LTRRVCAQHTYNRPDGTGAGTRHWSCGTDLGINIVTNEHHAGINNLYAANPLITGIVVRIDGWYADDE
jgi:hypothetical protein